MNTLKEKIQEDFIIAMKAKDDVAKSTLSGIKAKITMAEKSNSNMSLTDSEVIKVIISAVKQRKESISEFNNAGRTELAEKERLEMDVLKKYMPKQMSDAEIESTLREIIQGFGYGAVISPKQVIGKSIGEFNKKYSGMADVSNVKRIAETIEVKLNIQCDMEEEAILKDSEKLKELILKEYENGNVVVSGFYGLQSAKIDEIIKQPTTGLLYDLNRNEATILTFLPDPKWINDYASSMVIKALKKRIDELEEEISLLKS